jgi:hypothetical protein
MLRFDCFSRISVKPSYDVELSWQYLNLFSYEKCSEVIPASARFYCPNRMPIMTIMSIEGTNSVFYQSVRFEDS